MENKETAVQWLMETIETMCDLSTISMSSKMDIYRKARKMEINQIKDAYAKCYTPFSFGRIGDLNQDFTKYYEETYENS